MVFKSIVGAVCACLTVVSFNANSELVSRLGGLAYYDSDADLTWLADANYRLSSGHGFFGRMSWEDANNWATGLTVGGVDGWRLPSALNSDSTGPCNDLNCNDSEIGNMFYNVLGGVAPNSIDTVHNANYDFFINIASNNYWTTTEHTFFVNSAWDFNMYNGFQSLDVKTEASYAWAVRSGDVGALSSVPVPAAIWLFCSGLIGLVGFARCRI